MRLAAAAGAAALPGAGLLRAAAAQRVKSLPKPQLSGIKHVVVVMMENRSFDHFLGWLPGADGKQAGLSYTDRAGVAHPTAPLAPDYQGCAYADPDHSYEGGRIEYNNGACDGWLRAGQNDLFSIGYYGQNDLPFLANAALNWTALDRYFAPIMAETFPNRIYQHAAQTDRLENPLELSTLPTIWDRLAEHDLEGRYYFSDVPFTALWGLRYLPITRPVTSFFEDCAAGDLPEFCMVDPRFVGEEIGITNDDHPHADIRNGEVFLNSVYEAVTSSPNWPNTILVVNFDEWGGFYEHVPPPFRPVPPADAAVGNDGLLGFRVPALIISPWSRRGFVDHGVYDHTSVLKLLEWRWRLRALTIRDATANNLADALDFRNPNLDAPRFLVPPGPFGAPCPLAAVPDKWTLLAELAETLGFEVF
jgi:phospholipase C